MAARTRHGSLESESIGSAMQGADEIRQSTKSDGSQRGQIRTSGHVASDRQRTWLPRKRTAAAVPSSDAHAMSFLNGIGTARQLVAPAREAAPTLHLFRLRLLLPRQFVLTTRLGPGTPRHQVVTHGRWSVSSCVPCNFGYQRPCKQGETTPGGGLRKKTFACQLLPTAPVQPSPDPSKIWWEPHNFLSPDEQAHAHRVAIRKWRANG